MEMADYTVQVRTILEHYYKQANPLLHPWEISNIKPKVMCQMMYSNVFDFDFPQLASMSKQDLCSMILMHYYTREIGLETVGLWKQFLETRMNEIMPYYVELEATKISLADAMETRNLSEITERNGDENRDSTRNNLTDANSTVAFKGSRVDDRDGTSNESSAYKGKNLFSDTPQNGLQNVEDETYLTNATLDENSSNDSKSFRETNVSENDSSQQGHNELNENVSENENKNYNETLNKTYKGFDGNKVETLMAYRKSIMQIPRMIINDLADLFMGVY